MNRAPDGARARERLLAGLPVSEKRLELDGISTAVLQGGDGPPMVLLHGPASHCFQWLAVIPELARSHRVIVPDLPGHGATVVPAGSLDGERVLGWLGRLIERTCSAPPVIAGHALGGAIGARFAARHPDRVARLVLVDSMGLVPFRPAPEFETALMGFLRQPALDTHERMMEQCAFDLDRVRGNLGAKWQWLEAYNVDRAATAELGAHQQALLAEFGFPAIEADVLASIATPTTLVWGRHDRANRLQVAQSASARYGWTLHVLDTGADPAFETPEAVVSVLRTAQHADAVASGVT